MKMWPAVFVFEKEKKKNEKSHKCPEQLTESRSFLHRSRERSPH